MRGPPTPPPPPRKAACIPQGRSLPPPPPRTRRCHIVENVTALRARPRRPPLAAMPPHLHTGGRGLRALCVHWPQRPSLSLHKTHMELHVPPFGSSMKTRRARGPPRLVLWSGPFHFRPQRLPFKTKGIRGPGELGVARTTAGRGAGWARVGVGLQGTPARPSPGAESSLKPTSRDRHLEPWPETFPAAPPPPPQASSFTPFHSFHSLHIHSSLAADWAALLELRVHAHPGNRGQHQPRSVRIRSFQVAFSYFSDYASQVLVQQIGSLLLRGCTRKK